MKKFKEWLVSHKVWAFLGCFSLIVLLIILIVLIMMFMGTSSSKYGHRLDGIKQVTISSDTKDQINNIQDDKVASSNMRIQGKIIYIDINFKAGTSIDDAKAIAKQTLSEFSADELAFYDVCYFLEEEIEKKDGEDAQTGFSITGTKHPSKKEIGWIKG